MNIRTAKSIPLAAYLSGLGFLPVKRRGTDLWYLSPLRKETRASFKVNTRLNTWYDFGIGRGGNIILLAAEIYEMDESACGKSKDRPQDHDIDRGCPGV